MDLPYIDDYDFIPQIRVVLPCTKDYFDEAMLEEVIDIEEDMQGRDLLTFKCPECGKEHKSYRLG